MTVIDQFLISRGLRRTLNALNSQVAAIHKVQAVIEFTLDGHVLDANANFCQTMGYAIEEIRGRHHSMFIDPQERESAAYRDFWASLGRGAFSAGQFQRVAKGGRAVWLQASYNPVLDIDGKPWKVVKFATDITADKLRDSEYASQINAISRSQAVIEFTLDGKILNANENFCNALGYSLEEIRGQHHSIFVTPEERRSLEYRLFWEKLGRGEYDAGQYRRRGKDGRDVWIQATYNPILDPAGKPYKVVKYATDITAAKMRAAELDGQIQAIGKAQAVIEFSLDGKILTANENFCAALGYTLAEVRGKHHSMFVPAAERESIAYREFWEKLGRGEFDAGQYRRIGKNGQEVWIQATYNPILDPTGQPFKVVKFATDITQSKLQAADFVGQLRAISKAQAVIEFTLDGKILGANDNFCAALGYSAEELRGQHHSMFLPTAERESPDYRRFWEKLGRGESDTGQYRRIGKDGRDIWLHASYNPIFDAAGKPVEVIKYATDITAQKVKDNDAAGQVAAVYRSRGVMQCQLDGTIMEVNDNFTRAIGYTADELVGRSHSMLIEATPAAQAESRAFWE